MNRNRLLSNEMAVVVMVLNDSFKTTRYSNIYICAVSATSDYM